MTDTSIHNEFAQFRVAVEAFRTGSSSDKDVRIYAVLGVGILTGGGFPAAAAALAVLAERAYPSVDFPWTEP
jgi:hypothetical protein